MSSSFGFVDSVRTTLSGRLRAVFSKAAGSRAAVGLQDAGGDEGAHRRRRMRRAVGGGRHAVGAAEAGREGADAAQPDVAADVDHAAIGAAKERRRALQAPGEQVLVGRLAEGGAELAAEV